MQSPLLHGHRALICLACVCLFSSAFAANEAVWTPTNGINWSTTPTEGANWVNATGSVTPYNISGGNLVLQFGNSAGGVSNNNFNAGYSLGSITFLAGAGAYTLTGNQVSWPVAASPLGVITNSSSNDQRIDFDFALTASGNRSVSSPNRTLIFGGNATGAGTFYVTSGSVTFLGELANTGGAYRTNGGTLKLLNANNSFTADARAAAGILSTNNIANSGVNSSIGRGGNISLGQSYSNSVSLATLQLTNEVNSKTGLAGNAGSGTTNRSISISNGLSAVAGTSLANHNIWGGGILENTVAGETATFNGRVTSSIGSARSSLWMLGAGNGVINGSIATGTVATTPTVANSIKTEVVKAGTGTWSLNAPNVHAGVTTVYDGVLKIGNATALGSGGYTTAGSNGGTVVSAGLTRTVTSDGSSQPGTNAAAAGTLDLNGQTNINEVITLNGKGFANQGALVNNSSTPALISNGIASITMTSSGGNSGAPVTVTIAGGGGSGAAAVGTLGLTAQSFTITNGGSGYTTSTNGYSVLGISGGGGAGAYAKVVLTGGSVTGVEILNMGSGFSNTAFNVSVADAPGVTETAATITTNTNNYAIEVAVNNPGSGYTTAPTVTVSGTGTNTAVANLSSILLATASHVGGSGDIIVNAVISSANATADLTKIGAGTLVLNGINTYTSKTHVYGGTLQVGTAGSGSIGSGDVDVMTNGILAGTGIVNGSTVINGGVIRPGDAAGIGTGYLSFTSAGGLRLQDDANALTSDIGALLTLNGATLNAILLSDDPSDGIQTSTTGLIGVHDQIRVTDTLTVDLGMKFQVELASGYDPAIGDVFNLLDWGFSNFSGSANPNDFLVLPTLANGLWNTSQFFSDGIVYVVVPEPGRAFLLGLALVGMMWRRRRSF
jgi:fibronectin-binding autotransporter adhesin